MPRLEFLREMPAADDNQQRVFCFLAESCFLAAGTIAFVFGADADIFGLGLHFRLTG